MSAITPDEAAVTAWKFGRDLDPLLRLLSSGTAGADAQHLAAALLKKATKAKLPKRKNAFRHESMIMHWLMFMGMGSGSEAAKAAVADTYRVTVKAVEKVIRKRPDVIEILKASPAFRDHPYFQNAK